MDLKTSDTLPKINRVAISDNLAVLFCPSSNGKTSAVTIDRADLERVISAGLWHVDNFRPRTGFQLYCYRNKRGGGVQLLHRFLLNAPAGTLVDHAHHRTLDNRRHEIREATCSQNCTNSQTRRDSTTGLRGVTPDKGMFRARIRVKGKRVSLGHFLTAEEAATAYNKAAQNHHGEFAFTNSPERRAR